ncbi:MAG: aldo/keto reductase [Alphaproteobacteria bacterium]
MEKLQGEGSVESIGVSNFTAKKLGDLIEKAEIVPAVNQIENHPLLQQNDLIDFCHKNNIEVTAYSPLGSHNLTKGKESVLENPVIQEIAGTY